MKVGPQGYQRQQAVMMPPLAGLPPFSICKQQVAASLLQSLDLNCVVRLTAHREVEPLSRIADIYDSIPGDLENPVAVCQEILFSTATGEQPFGHVVRDPGGCHKRVDLFGRFRFFAIHDAGYQFQQRLIADLAQLPQNTLSIWAKCSLMPSPSLIPMNRIEFIAQVLETC